LKTILPSSEAPIHLSTLLCGAHRHDYILQIKRALKAGQTMRVISTQLIEAGVDVDFPVVYRAFAGLDSIIQVGGRCNREGKLDMGLVKVFVPPTDVLVGLLGLGRNALISIYSKIKDDILNPNAFKQYFSSFYSRLRATGEDFLQKLQVNEVGGIQFRTVGRTFRLIEEDTRPVLIPYKQGQELIDQLKISGMTRDLSRKLQRYTVSLRVGLISKHQSNLMPITEDYFVWVGPSEESIDVNIFEA
jgi:CRISPR-associated endonuclease/helicase Cas3